MILLVDKIEKSFGARVLFSGASFQINPGERFALVGPNGAGKTTMLKIIMGIDSPDAGQVQYAKDCQVGYLEQETNLEHKDTAILAEVMAAAKEIRRMGERANELQAQITELSEQGKDIDALLNEYGQVQDRFEHLGGYELESNARKILSGLGFKVTDLSARAPSSRAAGRCVSRWLSSSCATPTCCFWTSPPTTWTSKVSNGCAVLSPTTTAPYSSSAMTAPSWTPASTTSPRSKTAA